MIFNAAVDYFRNELESLRVLFLLVVTQSDAVRQIRMIPLQIDGGRESFKRSREMPFLIIIRLMRKFNRNLSEKVPCILDTQDSLLYLDHRWDIVLRESLRSADRLLDI